MVRVWTEELTRVAVLVANNRYAALQRLADTAPSKFFVERRARLECVGYGPCACHRYCTVPGTVLFLRTETAQNSRWRQLSHRQSSRCAFQASLAKIERLPEPPIAEALPHQPNIHARFGNRPTLTHRHLRRHCRLLPLFRLCRCTMPLWLAPPPSMLVQEAASCRARSRAATRRRGTMAASCVVRPQRAHATAHFHCKSG